MAAKTTPGSGFGHILVFHVRLGHFRKKSTKISGALFEISIKKLNSLKHLVRTTVAGTQN